MTTESNQSIIGRFPISTLVRVYGTTIYGRVVGYAKRDDRVLLLIEDAEDGYKDVRNADQVEKIGEIE